MHFELKDKFYKPLGDFGREEQLRQDADAAERKLILVNLKACLADYSDDETIDWFNYEMELQKGSSLYEIYVPGSVLMNELLSTVAIRSALTQENMSTPNLFVLPILASWKCLMVMIGEISSRWDMLPTLRLPEIQWGSWRTLPKRPEVACGRTTL
ncbi:hypothetical protein [Pseudomonas sp. F01002]|uniref:hypothetical protein n=1 Tax=Pseudomonas sp. F01002 TaxID=2555724 RepID=UPI00106B146E|nr:hypothetical protein [Pseudomonas sp. F01002]TFB44519.1 hypothetical protein E3W21_03430 [Pseudomonas sp. F01002]